MIPYTIQPRATAAIEDIYRYSRERWGEERADDYVLGFFETFRKIAERELPWRSVPADFGISGYRHRYRHHLIYWRQDTDGTVIIVAVLHERMLQVERLRILISADVAFDNDDDGNQAHPSKT